MSDEPSAFESALTDAFLEAYDIDESTADEAAAKAEAFREDYDEALTAERVIELVSAAPYATFDHDFNAAIGELAAENDDCTDSREYRLSSFGPKGADSSIGA